MIGLFLGSTDFPKKILNKIKKNKIKYFIIDLTKNNIFKKDQQCHNVSIGKFGQILNLIKEKKCKKVLFAGKIVKPKFSEIKFDLITFLNNVEVVPKKDTEQKEESYAKKENFLNNPECLLVIKKNEKISRNEKCPSTGKKYKNCCGAI